MENTFHRRRTWRKRAITGIYALVIAGAATTIATTYYVFAAYPLPF